MQRITVFSITLLLALAGITLMASNSPASAADAARSTAITIDNFSFAPQTVTIPTGTQVTWVNHDDIPHTVVSDDKATFKSHALDTDEQFSFTFTKPGTYTYFCSIHPKMTARIVVQ